MTEPREPTVEVEPHVVRDVDGKFWYADETENWGDGPFDTQQQASDALGRYCTWLETGKVPMPEKT